MNIKGIEIKEVSVLEYNGALPKKFTEQHEHHAFKLMFEDGAEVVFIYQCNRNMTPSCMDGIRAYALDAMCYHDNRRMGDFLVEYGYNETADSIQKGMLVYRACQRAYINLAGHGELTPDEIREVSEWEE